MADSLEFLDGEPGTCRIAVLRNVMIVHWTSRATAEAAGRLTAATDHVLETYPAGLSAVHVLATTAGLPTPEGRAGLIQIMNEKAAQIACVAVVVGGTGFWASAMRSFITGLRFVSPRNFDLRLHGTLEEVLMWLPKQHAKVTGVAIDERQLMRTLESVATWPDEGSPDVFSSSAR
jgi:hypothetical protein